ncbi:MAG TPA: hypothetical protein ENJ20_03070 [Bacteroidetes bacterium]|nr:hypothetical protein [Bacteroidota bacterium]
MNLSDDQHINEVSGSYEFYRDFHSVEQAGEFARMLEENRIPYKLEKSQTLLDAAIVGHGLVPPALIKIRSSDFKRLNELLRNKALGDRAFIENHYLQQLDDKELIAIVRRPNEWTVEDVAVARQILNDRGIPIPPEHVEDFNNKINAELRKGKRASLSGVLLYLVFVLLGGLFVNPFFLIAGIGMGWYHWQDKTVDNQGNRFFTFEKKTRYYGRLVFYIGWVSLLLGALLVYLRSISCLVVFIQPAQHFPVESVL